VTRRRLCGVKLEPARTVRLCPRTSDALGRIVHIPLEWGAWTLPRIATAMALTAVRSPPSSYRSRGPRCWLLFDHPAHPACNVMQCATPAAHRPLRAAIL